MAILGNGTELGHATTQMGSPTYLQNLFTTTTPEVKTEQVKTSHYGTAVAFHTYITGWKEGGEVTFEANYDKTEYAILDALQGQARWWTIRLPDSSTFVFPGFLDTCSITLPNEDKATQKGSIKVTGLPVFTSGT